MDLIQAYVFTAVGLVLLIFLQGSKKSLLESIPAQSDQEKEASIKKLEEKENSEDKDSDTARAEESLSTEVDAEEEQARSG